MNNTKLVEKFLQVKPLKIINMVQTVIYDYLPEVQGLFFLESGKVEIQLMEVSSEVIFAEVKNNKWVAIGDESTPELMEYTKCINSSTPVDQEVIYSVFNTEELSQVDSTQIESEKY